MTHGQARYRTHKLRLARLAESLGKDPNHCERCGKKGRKGNLHWHHRDPSAKSFSLATLNKRTDDELLSELAKCERLCKPCHGYHHSSASQGCISHCSTHAKTYECRMIFPTKQEAEKALQLLQNWKALK